MSQDIRWQQRFANYRKALARLTAAMHLAAQRPLSDLEKLGLIGEGAVWMDMIASRNRTSHTYNQATADAIANAITQQYQPQLMPPAISV